MVVFNHIPRTGGTFLVEKLRGTHFGCGPMIDFGDRGPFVRRLLCNREYRPEMLIYHTSGKRFEHEFKRRPGDFVFTLLRNRVDMVYSNFAYMSARIRRGDALPGWTAQQRSNFGRTMEEHVDRVLAMRGPDWEYPSDLDPYDFVGMTEEMGLSLRVLNEVFGTNILNSAPVNSVPCEKLYRRRDLEDKFAEQMRLFQRARELLRSRVGL
jgi:hypothetical protein